MPQFRHTYPYERHFPTLGRSFAPDEVVELDENPDPNFFEPVEAPKKPATPKSEED